MDQSLVTMLKTLWKTLPAHRHKQFKLLGILTIITAGFEIVSLSAVLPFMAAITQPDKVMEYSVGLHLARALGVSEGEELVVPITIAFAVAAVLAGAFRLLLVWGTIQLGNRCGADLSVEIYKRTLFQPYAIHISRSSSDIISGITQKVGSATGVLTAVVIFTTSVFLFIAILGTLIAVDPLIALSITLIFGVAYSAIAWSTRRRLSANSSIIASAQNSVVKCLQEGLGSIRDVLLDGTQNVYINLYGAAIEKVRRGSSQNSFMVQFPRYAMETLALVSVAAYILFIGSSGRDISKSVSLLAILALGAQRLLPIVQQIYGNWSIMLGNQAAISDILVFLEQPLPECILESTSGKMTFEKEMCLKDIHFTYTGDETPVLNNININIPKGSRVGIMGSTGSGKSTLVDLLMGLLHPSKGSISIDGNQINSEINRSSWQRIIAHVPQSIYLTDTSIAENIAFGVPPDQIDLDRVKSAAKQAQISRFIEAGPAGYQAVAGERGIRLSGGQRQRIGIARALYKNADVIIFDEATSALDDQTERALMQTIEGLHKDLTMFIVAHRLTTLKNCDFIIKLDDGEIVGQYEYNQVVSVEGTEK